MARRAKQAESGKITSRQTGEARRGGWLALGGPPWRIRGDMRELMELEPTNGNETGIFFLIEAIGLTD